MMRPGDVSDLSSVDPIDVVVSPTRTLTLSPLDVFLRRRAAMGLPAVTPPALVFLPIGYILGPGGLGWIDSGDFAHLDAALGFSLAVIGCFLGMYLARDRPRGAHLMTASLLQATLTLAAVATSVGWLLGVWGVQTSVPTWFVALALGLCGAASAAGAADERAHPAHTLASQIATLDDVLPVVLGGGALAFLLPLQLSGQLQVVGLALVVWGLLAVAGWLLFERARGGAERGVYVIGLLVVVAGSASYLRLSPLAAGALVGWLWRLLPGQAANIVSDGMGRLSHPLITFLLVGAGAQVVVDGLAIWLFAPLLVFRLAGKIVGGWAAARLVGHVAPIDLGAYLIAPGLIGIASALTVQQALGNDTGVAILSAVVAASLAAELLALVVLPGGDSR